jgi:division protein CdvB (Snf7/Vps24/ESCRT-III family)
MDKCQQLAEDIANATTVVHNQLTKVMMRDKRFAAMEAKFREDIAANIRAGNNARARILVNELSNICRVRQWMQQTMFALEAMVIRLSTMNEFTTILNTINPTIDMIKDIQLQLSKAVPEANHALSEVSTVASDILVNSHMNADAAKFSVPLDSDAFSLLSEIEGVLEQEARAKLPEVPVAVAQAQVQKQHDTVTTAENRVMVET